MNRLPITTPRLSIRAPKAGDAKGIILAHLESRPELEQWMGWARPWPDTPALKEFVSKAVKEFKDGPHRRFECFARDSDRLLVSLGCTTDNAEGTFHLNYWTRTGETGKGYATEAVTAFARYLFEICGAKRIESGYEPGNIASKRVLEKCGFKPEKIVPRPYPAKPKRLERICALTDVSTLSATEITFG